MRLSNNVTQLPTGSALSLPKSQHLLCGGVPSQIHMEFKGPQTTRAALERKSGAAGPTHFSISKLTTKPQQPEKYGTGLEIDM